MDPTIAVVGSETLVGQAVVRLAAARGITPLVAESPSVWRDSRAASEWFAECRPSRVIIAGGKSAGISGNQRQPETLMLDNLRLAASVFSAAAETGVERLLFLASSCCYPRLAPQPMAPSCFLSGPLEPTSQSYAIAKIAGVEACRAAWIQRRAHWVAGILADVYGPGDDYSPDNSHVIAALIRRMEKARLSGAQSVLVWGTGAPKRDFLFVDDAASAALFLLEQGTPPGPVNLGADNPMSIRDAAEAVRRAVGYTGQLHFDTSKPDGIPLKALDAGPLRALGWRPAFDFSTGLDLTVRAYRASLPRP